MGEEVDREKGKDGEREGEKAHLGRSERLLRAVERGGTPGKTSTERKRERGRIRVSGREGRREAGIKRSRKGEREGGREGKRAYLHELVDRHLHVGHTPAVTRAPNVLEAVAREGGREREREGRREGGRLQTSSGDSMTPV